MKSIFKNHYQVKILLFGLVFLLSCALGWAQEDELYKDGYLKPSELVQDFMNRDGNIGIKIYSLEQKKSWMIQVPDNAFVSDMVWSPDGKKIAFLAHLPQGTQVWTGDVKSGKAQAFNKSFVMATLTGGGGFGRGTRPPSQMLQWTSSGSIITVLVPPGRGPRTQRQSRPLNSPHTAHTEKTRIYFHLPISPPDKT